jgi:hypothetical protein
VPEDLAPNWDRPEAYWWRQGVHRAAHELAEKIRKHDWEYACGQGCCPGDGPEEAADLIDPEKEGSDGQAL